MYVLTEGCCFWGSFVLGTQCVGPTKGVLSTSQLQVGAVHGISRGCVRAHVYFLIAFERATLWWLTSNPKFGIPDIVRRKQTFLHLK